MCLCLPLFDYFEMKDLIFSSRIEMVCYMNKYSISSP